ncbi:hypothetical protein E2C01_089588 [Portunus trituberculatus]|uniref:Uncharacterized protein n=1 Tax=Portunus trituberculatus TaxID=210409 RepID=A0A5B7JCF5_PORTR|nr:hypothetical protein [Portunus trituberculatus]
MRFDGYSRAFSRFNIGSRPPMVNTCSYCNKIANKVEVATANRDEAKKSQLLTQKKIHLLKAKVARDLMTAYKQDTNPTLFAFAMDLQQTLVTPRLSTNVAYYKRKIWTYNFGTHNLKETTPATLYMWNEEIYTTDHYVELMREARREQPFNVVQMMEKLADLNHLLSFIPLEYKPWYKDLFTAQGLLAAGAAEDNPDDPDTLEDDFLDY